MNKIIKVSNISLLLFSSLYMLAACDKERANLGLRIAVISKDITRVKQCLDYGADRDTANSYGFTPLLIAARDNSYQIVALLLAEKATIDFQGNSKTTAVHMATRYDSLEVVQLLIKAQANMDLKDSFGKTALDYAKEKEVMVLLSQE